MVDVRRAAPADWEIVKAVRLRALADSPSAFGSTLAREEAFDEMEWRRRLGDAAWFLAWADHRPVGVAASLTDDQTPDERHLVAMWVEPDRRGTSVATELVESVCAQAHAEAAVAVTLWVNDPNVRARRLYERLGFTPTGERRKAANTPEVDERRMRRSLTTG